MLINSCFFFFQKLLELLVRWVFLPQYHYRKCNSHEIEEFEIQDRSERILWLYIYAQASYLKRNNSTVLNKYLRFCLHRFLTGD